MLDLTGANLVSYLIRILREAVSRNPRFTRSLGEVTFASNNMIQYNDAQITVRDVSTSGTRLSPDYFMCNQYGRALVAKVENKEGLFIEWIKETDKTGQTPEAGVYYLTIDAVDEQTNAVDMTIEKFRWQEGRYNNAMGSVVYLRQGVDGTTLTAKDATTNQAVTIEAYTNFIYLLQPTTTLQLFDANGSALIPLTDYWYQRTNPIVIIESTLGGSEIANVPGDWVSFTLVDQTGYQLRQGIDWSFYGRTFIQLSTSSPSGSTITANVLQKLDPSTTVGTNPENILQFGVRPDESLQNGQIFIHTTEGDYTDIILNSDGTATLPQLLKPGESVRWEIRINSGITTCRGKKLTMNGFYQAYLDRNTQTVQYAKDPITGERIDALPGISVAMGDTVVEGDQVAIIVSPQTTETYDVYGSKENLDFTLDIRSNDLQTSSDISELLKQQLLIMRRQNMEADGITIFEARRSYRGVARDNSGTAPAFIYSVSISASADWKVFIPKVTRVAAFEITEAAITGSAYKGKLQMAPRVSALGENKFQFLNWRS